MNELFVSHITIIAAVYPPEPVVSAQMASDLVKFLTDCGNQSMVICPMPSRPASADYRQFTQSSLSSLQCGYGLKIVRVPSFTAPLLNFKNRIRESFSFGIHVCRYLDSQKSMPDVLYVNAWPLLAQALIARFAKNNNIPMVLQIMDIYPESLITKLTGPLKQIVTLPLKKLDTWTAQQAAAVVVISDNMRQTYIEDRGISPEKVITINTWQDEELFNPHPDKREACTHYGVPIDRFTFLYLGNIGPVAGVEFLIHAFHKANIDNAQLVIAGDGSAKDACKELADSLSVDNVRFISDPDVKNVPLLQSMAEVCLLPLKHGAGMSSIPSKLPAYLFSAKPVLATVDAECETAQVVRQANCGWVGEPENIDWLVSKMKDAASLSTHELETLGQRGREYGLAHFSKAEGVSKLANVILANTRKP